MTVSKATMRSPCRFALPQVSLARRGRPTANEAFEQRRTAWLPLFTLMWFSTEPFVYETLYGGAEKSLPGRSVARLSTLTGATLCCVAAAQTRRENAMKSCARLHSLSKTVRARR